MSIAPSTCPHSSYSMQVVYWCCAHQVIYFNKLPSQPSVKNVNSSLTLIWNLPSSDGSDSLSLMYFRTRTPLLITGERSKILKTVLQLIRISSKNVNQAQTELNVTERYRISTDPFILCCNPLHSELRKIPPLT